MPWLRRSTNRAAWNKILEQVGIFRLEQPLPFGMASSNMYLCMGPPKVLIDGGFWFPECLDVLRENLAFLSVQPEEIHHVFLTHAHIDHVGVAIPLRKYCGTNIWAHPKEAVRLDGWQAGYFSDYLTRVLYRLGADSHMTKEMIAAFEEPIRYYKLQVLDRFEPLISGHRLPLENPELEILHTPGHSGGSVCFMSRKNRLMFSGDMLTPVGNPMSMLSVEREKTIFFEGLMEMERSLEFISRFNVELVLSGHGPPAEYHCLADAAKSSFQTKRISILKNLDSDMTPFALTLKKTNTDKSLNLFMQLFDTRAYLEALMTEGKVRSVIENGVEVFSQNRI